ncbi:TIR domain-containing protein [Fuscovulum ytuae]|uniref:TIR domain-containing protein n=1 Tax=Fuscovulum ytuae TaxID=3042299 RepID=A0ABY8Q7T9_9RHOB|nr:TIR domain-containing protein [Fuscovulum sp. YMD61]WGV16277.1 TIR domain-containing protein [Fuscovulum sp. YMD61]
MEKTYRIFISHSWKYGDSYDRLVEFLNEHNVAFYDHSVPKNDPIHTSGSDSDLQAAIDAKIRGCSGVIILAGVYATYSKWINKEVSISLDYRKPIIAVEPWAAERTSAIVKNSADRIVKWNGKSIATAVRDLF